MKGLLNIAFSVLLVTAVSSFVFAEEPKGSMMGKEMKGSMMGNEGMMEKSAAACKEKMAEMCNTSGMMMKSMTGKAMAAPGDAGVIVMSGNKLSKYDKDLNLVKEIEIKNDTECMKDMMMQMKENCPAYKEMMHGCGMMNEEGEGSEESSDSKGASGHEAHH